MILLICGLIFWTIGLILIGFYFHKKDFLKRWEYMLDQKESVLLERYFDLKREHE